MEGYEALNEEIPRSIIIRIDPLQDVLDEDCDNAVQRGPSS